MNIDPLSRGLEELEQFRNKLFYLQLQGSSLADILQFLKHEGHLDLWQRLEASDPALLRRMLAREHVLQARHSRSGAARDLLTKAIELDPECPEACLELGRLADTPEAAMMWYQRAMEQTERMLGKERLQHLLDEFRKTPWRQTELHTFLKAKACLAERLFRSEHYAEAADHLRELIDWNPSDDLCVRHLLLVSYLQIGRLKEAAYLIRLYRGDWSVSWYYAKAFHRFLLMGDSSASRRWLLRAFHRNLWMAVYLLGLAELPPVVSDSPTAEDPEVLKVGSKAEALHNLWKIAPVFYDRPALVEWTWNTLREAVR